ncbi:MAG: hypothetical protein FWF86_00435 [Clostridia bacterium]|nr:hypothetical protein [Clostridia bacterium]
MGKLYGILAALIRGFSRPMTTVWETGFDGAPAVFCPNHAGAFGPIAICARFPLRGKLHPWMNDGMMHAGTVPAYVRQDYWWKPGCFWEPLLTRTLPYIAAAIVPPILRSVPGVPVYHDVRVVKTFRKSLAYLQAGEHLVIFAEQPDGFQSHSLRLNDGFLRIAPLIHRKLGIALKFYPVHVDGKNRIMRVGIPAQYDPAVPLAEQSEGMMEVIRAGIRPG